MNRQITKGQARRFLLLHQGLCPAYPFEGKAGVLDYIRRVGCIQFDPLNIAGQNADLVLQARLADYRPELLHELLYEDRALLDGIDKMMSIYTVEDWHVLRRIGGVGMIWNHAGDVWLGMVGTKSPERTAAIERLVAQGKLEQVIVEGIKDPFYFCTQDQATCEAALTGGEDCPTVRLMAPLDNLLWDRRMLKALFDFEYTWEVYVPAAKRRYGYYTLPVLAGECFIARCEPVYDHKLKALVLKNWWWEAGVEQAAWAARARQALERLGNVLGAKELIGEIPV